MSARAAWTGSIATVVGVAIAAVTLYLQYWSNDSQPPPRPDNAEVLADQPPAHVPKTPEVDSNVESCGQSLSPSLEAVENLSLTIDRDRGFEGIVERALRAKCFHEALRVAAKLSLTIDRDKAYTSTYEAAISEGDYGAARQAIDRLSLTIDRDSANLKLLEALKDEK